MGIEVKIEAASAEELHQHIVSLASRFATNVTFPADPIATSEEVAEEQPKKRTTKKSTANSVEATASSTHSAARASASPAAIEGNEPTGSTDENTPSSGTASEATEAGEPDPADEPTLEYADVQKAVTQLAAAKGRDAVLAVYKKFSVDHATKLKPEQWADAVAELNAAREV